MFLQVNDLKVAFSTEDGVLNAVDGLSFSLERGRTLAIVGESGSGKTATILAIMGLHDGNTRVGGSILLDGEELVGASAGNLRRLRGERMAMIFQDPLTAMHPYHRIGAQITEAYRAHHKSGAAQARKRALELLDRVGLSDPARCFESYPHQLSGGMRQRAMIAMALVCSPDLLIADEPTTALDVTIQAQILELLGDLQKEFNSATILVTHDLGVVADLADDVVVLYGGKAAETGSVRDIFYRTGHPYTHGLLGSIPRIDQPRHRLDAIPGAPPSLSNMPTGCRFNPRCRFTAAVPDDRCLLSVPSLVSVEAGHFVSCHLGGDLQAAAARVSAQSAEGDRA
ncbi:ABC transporter ATP-binding protein [Nitratireductor pacificus]|uniref:Peptide ABC transporter ATPase n=1 Tax=Nitratireductor pacificus pht-3B TaxID=391937 RepID=K2N2Z4_9HYPH|nr:ABC transporter ATP-binding protein [Nitratireductor pacificus]EKF18578.1 peptide ABC transporter ATPase [Nitratireductor pacificus pht-3B]